MSFFGNYRIRPMVCKANGISFLCLACVVSAHCRVFAQSGQDASNPLGSTWQIENEFVYTPLKGGLFDKIETQFVYNLQPVMAFPMGKGFNLLSRVTIPFGSSPFVKDLNFSLFPPGTVDPGDNLLDSLEANIRYASGVGDTAWVTLFSPVKSKGFNWGFGPTFILPTASREELGSGLWQGGPAVIGMYMGAGIMGGLLFQNWASLGGTDANHPPTNHAAVQYFYWYFLTPELAIGGSPVASIDWKKEEKNRYTVPIGLAVNYTTKIGKLPIKIIAEYDWIIKRPEDNPGPEWMFKLRISPIIPSPFSN